MSVDQMVSADAWERLVREVKELGPSPDDQRFIQTVIQIIWDTEGITLDEDHR